MATKPNPKCVDERVGIRPDLVAEFGRYGTIRKAGRKYFMVKLDDGRMVHLAPIHLIRL